MRIPFLADEDLKAAIVDGLRSRESAIDIFDVERMGPRGMSDPVAAAEGRIVISHDRRTMTRHLRERLDQGKSSPGLFVFPQRAPVGEVVEWLLLIWSASEPAEWRDGIHYLPLR